MTHANELPTGIRRTDTGYQTYRWKKDPSKPRGGYQASKRWPGTASLSDMRAWLKETELRGKRPELFAELDETASTFAADAEQYKARDKVQRMPTKVQRIQHIDEWVAIFGRRDRATIEPQHIQAELDKMRSRLAAGSVNKRRTALMDLWTVLDGRHQANPVKATAKCAEPEPEPRAPAMSAVLTLLKGLPDDTDNRRKVRARLQVLCWTGWPDAIIKQLQPGDLPNWKAGRAYVPRRRKGKGARARWLPLLPQAVSALKAFHAADAYGPYGHSNLHKPVSEFCRDHKMPHIRPYDLRHFFGTLIATLTTDERAIMELMLVSSPQVIRRYTDAATNPRVQAAVKGIIKQLPQALKLGQDAAGVLPVDTKRRKR